MWSAAILAGGRATRFEGRDKGALVVNGETIRTRQLVALSEVADDIMIVGGDVARRLQPSVVTIPFRAIADRVPDCGPLGGLYAALTESRGGATAIVEIGRASCRERV